MGFAARIIRRLFPGQLRSDGFCRPGSQELNHQTILFLGVNPQQGILLLRCVALRRSVVSPLSPFLNSRLKIQLDSPTAVMGGNLLFSVFKGGGVGCFPVSPVLAGAGEGAGAKERRSSE